MSAAHVNTVVKRRH